jgi:hypothetical protein
MVVTMIAVGMVQLSIHEVINVVAMGHGFVPARRAMLVRAARFWRALHRIGGIDGHDMLINMIPMHVMKMAIMEIIDMAIMADRRMPTIGTMLVGVIGMMLFGAGGHRVFPLFDWGAALLAFSGMFDGAFHQTQNVSVGKRIVDVFCLASSFDKSHVV